MASRTPPPQLFQALARTLPERLITFFSRYPPKAIIPATGAGPQKTLYQKERPNPFEPWKNPATGKWRGPVYSLRRQADLVKLARKHGIEELLPRGPKGSETRLARRVRFGLRVKGTGVGQKVKGHKFERVADEKMDKKREAIKQMYPLVKEWRKLGAYRWKKFPK